MASAPFLSRSGLGAAGAILVALGLAVIAGWHGRVPAVIQIHPDFVPMQYNTALCFLLAGSGLLVLFMNRWGWWSIPAGSAVGLIGLLTLVEYAFNSDLGIDQFFMQHYITVLTPHPGRMAPNTALCFMLAGIAIILAGRQTGTARLQLVSLLGALVIALGTVAFSGYVFGIPTAYGWGHLTRMAAHTSLGFIVLGAGLVISVWQTERIFRKSLPVTIGIATTTITVAMWQALHAKVQEVAALLGEQADTWGDEFALAFGLAMSAALAYAVANTLKAQRSARTARDAHALLNAEMEERKQAEEKLRKSEEHFRAYFEKSMVGMATTSIEKGWLEVNDALCASLGYSRDELTRMTWAELTHPEDLAPDVTQFDRLLRGEINSYAMDKRFIHKDGHMVYTRLAVNCVRKDDGSPNYLVALVEDITERKLAEKELREKEERLALATIQNGVGVWDWNLITQEMIWDDSMYSLYHIRREDFIGTEEAWRAALHPDDLHRGDQEVNDAIAGIRPFNTEFRVVWPNGEVHHIKAVAKVFRNEQGAPLRMLGINMDITELKRAEERLRISEERLALAARTGNIGIWDWDVTNNILLWDDSMYRLYGIRREDFGGAYEAWVSTLHPEDRTYIEGEIQAALRGEREYAPEFRVVWPDGSVHYIKAASHTLYDDNGKPLRMVGINYDMTERKLAEQELREKEERLALATIHNGVGVWDWNLVTQEMIWDDSMFSLYHIRREDFIGTEEAWRTALHPDDLHRGDQEVNDAIAGIKPFNTEFRVVWPEGEIRHIKAVAKVFRDEQGTPLRMLGINMDITELRRAESIQTARLRLTDFAANHTLKELLVATLDEACALTGSSIGFYHFLEADQKTLSLQAWSMRTTREFCKAEGEGSHYDIDQAGVWVDCVRERRPVIHNDYEALPHKRGMPPGHAHVEREMVVPIFRNELIVAILGVGNKTTPYRGNDLDSVTQLADLAWDIAEAKRAGEEVHRLNAELEQRVVERTAQLEAANQDMEGFSYSVSHDLRSPLRAIDGFSRILLEDYAASLDDEGRRLLHVVGDNARKMGELIDDILAFSRTTRQEVTRSEIDMTGLVREIMDELKPETAGRELKLELDALPPARADRSMLHQVLLNLLGNAVKFTRHQAPALIEVGARSEGNEIIYHVKDNGVGFDMRYADKLFGVFHRLHGQDEFEGTGIGLAIVKRIITKHGGRVWAEGKPNEGAAVYFTLPI